MNAFDAVEPKAMGQLANEASKRAHELMMSGEDSVTPQDITDELNKGNPWVSTYDNGLTRDESFSYLLVANRGAW